ncbi:MAG TPA: AAA family ATPase [Symbiobacteriaceae bacterium]|nr:AAA family ATPase [Symbiobacteriaceae bacterium]
MLTRLRLERFKNFQDAVLYTGPLTILVGANATGKSNVREALRFVHGIARGYTLAEIVDEKRGLGGELQWRGIRGGFRDLTYLGARTFALEVDFQMRYKGRPRHATYRIEVEVGDKRRAPHVVAESLWVKGVGTVLNSHPGGKAIELHDSLITVELLLGKQRHVRSFVPEQPVIAQLADRSGIPASFKAVAGKALEALHSMRFHDLDLGAIREPSTPGQKTLGDGGENLSSVLQAICANEEQERALVAWLRALTPLDADGLAFPEDAAGRVLVNLREGDHLISAISASDGTLRFLAMLAALLGPRPAECYFFDELETGIHPTRLHLLVQLIEQRVRAGGIQVIATTHSPQLLAMLSRSSLEGVSLVYRLPGKPAGRIKRILEIPDAKRVVEQQDVSRLHASGWLEDAVFFTAEEEGGDE